MQMAHANDWSKDTVYLVMLDRFADGDPSNNEGIDPTNPLAFHGGDLVGLIEQLDEIHTLGANVIWITPLQKQVPPITVKEGLFHGHHGYWANNFNTLDPRFGDEETLKTLVDKAHDLDMKVILDVVYNHVGYGSDWITQHPDWIRQGDACGGDPLTLCLAGLPDIKTERADVRAHLFEAHIGLAERVGLDGFRLDTVKHISHEFWQEHRAIIRERLGPNFLLLGEVWDADKFVAAPYFDQDEMDAIFDFGFRNSTLKFLTGVSDAQRYGRYIANRHDVPTGKLLAHFISNHDLPMMLALLRGNKDKLRVALTLMLTQEGLPILAWGEEVGRKGGIWPKNRQDMPWGNRNILPGAGVIRDETLRADVQRLIALRKNYPSLTGHEITVVHSEGRRLAYLRGEDILVLVNADKDVWQRDTREGWTEIYSTHPNSTGTMLEPFSAMILSRFK